MQTPALPLEDTGPRRMLQILVAGLYGRVLCRQAPDLWLVETQGWPRRPFSPHIGLQVRGLLGPALPPVETHAARDAAVTWYWPAYRRLHRQALTPSQVTCAIGSVLHLPEVLYTCSSGHECSSPTWRVLLHASCCAQCRLP